MQTIGERLEEARKKKGISIREAAEATKIRGDYLSKFESNHFDIGLTEIYTRGFLRTYSNFLKLPADRILNDYAALGRGDLRPRQPNREVYGRMDITVASAEEPANERTAAPASEAGAAEPAATRQASGNGRPRTGSSLPSGPDPAVIFRYVKWGGVVIGALLVVLIIKSLFSGGPKPTTPSPTPSIAAPAVKTLSLVALGPVNVRVSRANADGTEGTDLFNGMLSRGQVQTVVWEGPIFINYSAGENLEIEFQGKRYPTGQRGSFRSRMEAPPK